MASLAPVLRKSLWASAFGVTFYASALLLLTNASLQRHVLYAHKVHTAWWHDINKPEQFGFAKNQITPFNFTTPDNETLYAWHVMPLGLYAKHEGEILKQPSGCVEDITQTKSFKLLQDDPDARLIINFHGNAGTVAQGWRPDIYRALSDGSTSSIHILAVDYRGFGYSTGSPSEPGVIIDGISTVKWALEVAKIPANRIVIIGHSLGTAVTAAVSEHFALQGIEFAGIVLISGFSDIPRLLTSYAIGGWVPILSPLRQTPTLQKWFSSYVVDTWTSEVRIANFVRHSKRARLFIIHARDDYEIPWFQSDILFEAAANATTIGMDAALLSKMKARGTLDMGDGAFISTWKSSPDTIIRQEIVAYGGHNRIMTYAPVALAALKAFGLDEGGLLPQEGYYAGAI